MSLARHCSRLHQLLRGLQDFHLCRPPCLLRSPRSFSSPLLHSPLRLRHRPWLVVVVVVVQESATDRLVRAEWPD